MSDLSSRLRPAGLDSRARPAEPPSWRELEELRRKIGAGAYRVDARRVAEAILSGRRPPARRG